jgi:long-chain acyl-CoA synthetase
MNNRSFYQVLKDTANTYPKENALCYENKYFKYQTVLKETDKLASSLKTLGVKKHDVVTICMPNTPEAVYSFYAVSKIGAICYEVHPKTTLNMMRRFLKNTNSHILIVLNLFVKEFLPLTKEMDLTIISCNPFEKGNIFLKTICRLKTKTNNPHVINYHSLKTKEIANEDFLSSEETSVYLNTGGTSGEPKIIELSSKAINNLAGDGTTILGITDPLGIHMLGVLPMFHGFGLCMGIHAPITFGACVSLMTKFNAKKTIKLIKKNRCNIIIGVPGLFKSLLKQPSFYNETLKNLHVSYVGGDFVPADLTKRFNEAMEKYNSPARLFAGYGLTETVTVCNVNTNLANKPNSVGKCVSDFKNKIVDLNTREELPPYEVGEICVSGTSIMNGYLDDEELTNKTIITDKDGVKWILTGDFGYLDEDNFLFFKQRLKRIIKVSGVIICPSDVENAVNMLDEVFDVYATDISDDNRGSMIKLFVVKNDNYQINNIELEEKIKKIISDEVSVYAIPKEIVYMDKLPKTDVGKTDSKYLESIK